MPGKKKFDVFENTEDLESMFLINIEDLGSIYLGKLKISDRCFLTNIEDLESILLKKSINLQLSTSINFTTSFLDSHRKGLFAIEVDKN